MELINAAVKPDHVATFKKQLDKAELNVFAMELMSSAS